MQDQIVEEVRKDLLERSKRGVQKYGITLDKENLPLKQWLLHQYEELLDAALYCKKAIIELEKDDKR